MYVGALEVRKVGDGRSHFDYGLIAGAAEAEGERVEIAGARFGWTWERFHVYTDDTFIGDRGVTVIVPRDYKNGYTLRLGTEYAGLPGVPGLKLRAGILRDISPSRPETTSPTLPDSDVTVDYCARFDIDF